MPTVTDHPVTDIDPFSAEYLTDPYGFHAQLRELAPVVRLERYGAWACARYDEVRAVLSDPEEFVSGHGTGLADIRAEGNWRVPSLLLENDPPDHTRVRKALMGVLSPRNVRALRDLFTARAVLLVDEVLACGTFDAVADFAQRFPMHAVPDAVGLVTEGREKLLAYGRMVFDGMGPHNDIYRRVMADADETVSWITAQCRREALAPGGLGSQVYSAVDAGLLTEDEGALVVRSFLSAGVDTTVHALASTIYCLARNPGQWALLREDPALVRFAFEEALRIESPFQQFFRTTARDTALSGVTLPAGEKVLVIPASANRDPRRWEEPERFDVRRKPVGHLAFGHGIHSCVGQVVARLEAEVLLTELVSRVRRIEPADEPRWGLSNTLRGLEYLPVTIQ